MIASGIKKEEYREMKPSWMKRFGSWEDNNNQPDIIHAFNGWAFSEKYSNIKWKHEGIGIGKPNPKWCEPEDIDKTFFILYIGKIIKLENILS